MSKDISISRLKEVLDYSQSTGVFTWKEREGKKVFNSCFSGEVAGNVNVQGYIQIQIDNVNFLAHRLAWLWVHGEWPDLIDHLDGDRANNRLGNLESTNYLGNARNTVKGLKDKGIVKLSSGMYRVVVSDKHIGCYKTKEMAKVARDAVYVFGGFSGRHKEES